MSTQYLENIGVDWINITSELSLIQSKQYIIQNVTPYPLELFINSSEPSVTDSGHALCPNSKIFVVISAESIYVRNQKKDDLKKARIAVTENINSCVLYDFNGNEITYDNPLNVIQKFRSEPHSNLYLYRTDAEPSLTSGTNVNDVTINIDSNTNVSNGDAITIYEDNRIFQSLVVSSTTTSITMASKIDYTFTTNAMVEVGPWNAAVDGSSTEQVFSIKAPMSATLAINSVSGTILDGSDMDDAKFGGLSALSNGIIYRLQDGDVLQLALIVNNIGFFEYGFNIEYADKAPAGSYGFRFRRDLVNINGSVLSLTSDHELQLIVRDDLTDLTQFTTITNGRLI